MADRLIPRPKRNAKPIAALISLATAAACAAAAGADSDETTTSTSGTALKGGVHDAGTLQPSARLIPGSDQVQPVEVKQYAGSEHDKLHPPSAVRQPPVPPVPLKGSAGSADKIHQPPPEPKLWGSASDDERPSHAPPAWGQDQVTHPPVAVTPQTPPAHLPAPKKPVAVTPPNGVMTWQPGHSVSQVKPQKAEPLHFTWAELKAILMNKDKLAPEAPRRYSGTQPLAAKQLALPHHLPANWDEWYQGVAHAIYQVWQQEQVSPGTATVRTTVFASQDVDCQIFDFKPAADAKRNPSDESFFRDAALKSVNSINKSGVCQFPADQHPKKVVFDIQLTRLVNGPAGCDVIHTHQNPTMGAAQK